MIATEIGASRRRYHVRRFLAAVLCLGCPLLAAAPEVLTLRVTGRADGIGSAAQTEALQAAQSEAVVQYLHSLVPSDDPALHPALQPILRHTAQYAASCHVLRCDETGGSTRIEADVTLSEDALRYDVATLMLPRLSEKPKVLLVLGEQIGKDDVPAVLPDSTIERTVGKGLEQFHLVPSSVKALQESFEQKTLIEAVTSDVPASTAFASHTDYDAVVLGAAVTKLEPGAPGTLPRIVATVTVRVHRGRDGAMVGQTSATAAVYSPYLESGGEQAVQDAATRVLRKTAVDCVAATLGRQTQDRVLLTIERPGPDTRVQAVTDLLQGLPGVTSVQPLFHETERCRIRIGYTGPMADLTDAISSASFAGSPIKIRSVLLREILAKFE